MEKPGLRERKKKQTRLEIAAVATRMFIERGFERVTIAEVAEAANVSVNTIFNYFVTKEDLFFDLGEEVTSAASRTVKDRASGESVVDVLHRRFQEMLAGEEGPFRSQNLKPFVATIEASAALQAKARLLFEQAEIHLAQTLAEESATAPNDPSPKVVAALLTGLFSLLFQEFRAAILAEQPPQEYRAKLAAIGERGFAMLRAGIGDYCKRP